MKMLKHIPSIVLALAVILTGCSGGSDTVVNEVDDKTQQYELIASVDEKNDLSKNNKFVVSGNSAFYVKNDSSASVLMKVNLGDNTEEEISKIGLYDRNWIYANNEWVVFYSDNAVAMKYNIASKELSPINQKEMMHNVVLDGQDVYYLNSFGLLCSVNLIDAGSRMIDQSVLNTDIEAVFTDGSDSGNIYYWGSDALTLIKYCASEASRTQVYKKSADEMFFEKWYADGDVIYSVGSSGFKVIKDNEVVIDEIGAELVADEHGGACYRKDGSVFVIENGETSKIAEGDYTPAFLDRGTVVFYDDSKFYTVNNAGEIINSTVFDGKLLSAHGNYLYAQGRSEQSEENGIYKINFRN